MRTPVSFRHVAALGALFCWCLAAGAAFAGMAPPRSAVFYPRAAQLNVEERRDLEELPGGARGFVITLPVEASHQSFTLELEGAEISGTAWGDMVIPREGEEEKQAAMAAQLAAAHVELGRVGSELAAKRHRIELLQSAIFDEEKGIEELARLDALLNERLTPLMADIPVLERSAREWQDAINTLSAGLSASRGSGERYLAVTVTVDGAPSNRGQVIARYSYMLPGCGWTPAYTAEAMPEKGLVRIVQQADLVQNTSTAWNNVDISVATITPDRRPEPSRLPAWYLRVGQPEPLRSERSLEMSNTQLMQSAPMADAMMAPPARTAPPAPVREEKTTFALWHVGKRGIPAASQARVTLAEEEWKSDFYYTIRPMLDARGFLTAAARPEIPADMPPGPAVFLVDGTVIGQGNLTLHGDLVKIYFGADPLVTAVMRNDQRQTGESGIISKDQTLTWSWTITVNNARAKNAVVQVEDPSPVSGDEAVKLTITSTPKPELNNLAYTWRFEMEAGESRVITHEVKAVAPKEAILSPGR